MFTKIFAFFFAVFSSLQMLMTPNVIRIDFDNVIDEIRPVHNIDRMPEYITDSEVNKYFTEANMVSCRTHDINCTDIFRIFPDFSADVNDENSYNFKESDKVVAAIVDTGMKPFFRLGISYSDPIKSHVHLLPPADYGKWAQICEHIILHYNEGWADGFNYDIEYWEIWNEPDGGKYEEISETEFITENAFWHGSPEQFYRLYDVAATYLKGRFPDLKFGGYGSCGFYALTKTNNVKSGAPAYNKYFIEFFQGFLDYIKEHKPPMDFFTWHSYTTTEVNTRWIKYVNDNLKKAGYGDAEVICDEWNYNPTENDQIDRRYGANQTSMLCMFQNEGLDMAHYYDGDDDYLTWAGLFVRDRKPSSAYYGFYAFGQLYKMGSQVEIKNKLRKDMYAVAARDDNGNAALLISNVSEKHDRPLKIDAGRFTVDKVMTVNENCEWVETELPEKIESGSMLYITFTEGVENTAAYGPVC